MTGPRPGKVFRPGQPRHPDGVGSEAGRRQAHPEADPRFSDRGRADGWVGQSDGERSQLLDRQIGSFRAFEDAKLILGAGRAASLDLLNLCVWANRNETIYPNLNPVVCCTGREPTLAPH
jgi:hypothetical protein